MKKAIMILLAILFVFVGVRATTLAEGESDNKDFGIISENSSSDNTRVFMYRLVDSVTKVEYIVVSQGVFQPAIAICPRYNADGTFYTGD